MPYRRKKLTFAISSSDEFLCVSVLTSVCKLHLCIHLAAFVYYVIALFAAGFERVLNGWMHVLENLNCYRTCSNASFRARTSRFSLFLMYVSVSCLYKVKQYMPASSNRTELYHSQCFSFVVAKKNRYLLILCDIHWSFEWIQSWTGSPAENRTMLDTFREQWQNVCLCCAYIVGQ